MNIVVCHKLIDITKTGLTLECAKEKLHISFCDCAKNFSLEKGRKFNTCVATRDITTLSFVFYTQPKTIVVFKRKFLKDLIPGKSATARFLEMQKAIIKAGYTSYDLS